jgi:hypothetical protein
MTTSSSFSCFVLSFRSFSAYATAAAGSWIEQGPMITSSRSDLPRTISRTRLRVSATSFSTGVPWIGKKRIRFSGGGSGTMFSMRSSSVSEVLSAGIGPRNVSAGLVMSVSRKQKTARHLCAGGSQGWVGVRLSAPLRQRARVKEEKAVLPTFHGTHSSMEGRDLSTSARGPIGCSGTAQSSFRCLRW